MVTLPFAVKLTLDAFLDSELKMDDLKAAMVESVQEDCLYRCADPGSADRQGDALSRDVCGKQKMGKATKLNLILTAATYKNIEEINFDILAHNLDSLPEEFLHSALTKLGFTFKKDYLFYPTKYLDHENGRIRADVINAINEIEGYWAKTKNNVLHLSIATSSYNTTNKPNTKQFKHLINFKGSFQLVL